MPKKRLNLNWLPASMCLLAMPGVLHAQIFTWTDRGDRQNNPWMASMVWAGFSAQDDDAMVAKLQALPPGKRCLFLWNQNHTIFTNPDDGPVVQNNVYWPAGIAFAHAVNTRVINALAAENVQPDFVISDVEDQPNSYNMTLQQMIHAENDPHTVDLDWPTLPFATRADEYQFNEMITIVERAAIREGVFTDFEQFAPAALTSNFAERVCTPDEAIEAPDIAGNPYSTTALSGNAQAPGMYLTATAYPPTQSPFCLAVYGTNVLRTSVRHGPVLPWYGSESVDGVASWAGTGYWEEFLRHGLLTCGVQGMLFDANDPKGAARVSTILFDLLKTCNGTLPQTLATTDLAIADSQWFASARVDTDPRTQAITRIVARVTFAPGVSRAHVVVAGKTFDVVRPPRKMGAWIRWNSSTNSKLY